MTKEKMNNYSIEKICGEENAVINFGEGFGSMIFDVSLVKKENEKESLMLDMISYLGSEISGGDKIADFNKLDKDKMFSSSISMMFHGEQSVKSLRTMAKNFSGMADSWEEYLEDQRQREVLKKNISLIEKGIEIAAVKFEGKRKKYYFRADLKDLSKGENVVVETFEGLKTAIFDSYVNPAEFTKLHPVKSVLFRKKMMKNGIENYSLNSEKTLQTPSIQKAFK